MEATLRLADLCGPHCGSTELAPRVVAAVDELGWAERVWLSFAGVVSVSPSFLNALLLAIQRLRVERPELQIRFTGMTAGQRAVVESAVAAFRRDQRRPSA